MHIHTFTPSQLARADELAGDLTLASDDPERDARLAELEQARVDYQGALDRGAGRLYIEACRVCLMDAKIAWARKYGQLPEFTKDGWA